MTSRRRPWNRTARWFAGVVVAVTLTPPAAGVAAGSPSTVLTPIILARAGSSDVVFVLATTSCPQGPCLRLARTDDNGASFTDATTPPVAPVAGQVAGSIDQLVFVSPRVGYVLEVARGVSTVYATTDGARTWGAVWTAHGVQVTDLAATAGAAYVVTSVCARQANGNTGCTRYRLEHFDVASRHWSSTPIPNGRDFPWGFLGNAAAYAGRVWLTEGAKWSIVVTSDDRGRTLVAHDVPTLGSTAGCYLTATSLMVLWAQCPGGMQSQFFRSGDGGATWTLVPAGQWSGTGGGFFDPVSGNVALLDYGLHSGPFTIFRVTDDGRRLVGVGRSPCSDVTSAAFVSATRGIALCGNYPTYHVVRTSDAGARWVKVRVG